MNAFGEARNELQRVAVHLVARARVEGAGRFSLRVTPGGFGTPEIGPDSRRVRVIGSHLVVESDAPGAPSARSIAIDGASLAQLATFAGVDLTGALDVGHDTPPLGDINAPIALDDAHATAVCDWYQHTAAILDLVLAELPADAMPTLPRLWPEHFDVAIEAQARPDQRVNLGGSPGDGSSDEPYLYVGPWTADRPGDAEFWNAPYGAMRTRIELASDPSGIVAAGAAFLLDGYGRLRRPTEART
jgi:hypothetical protein